MTKTTGSGARSVFRAPYLRSLRVLPERVPEAARHPFTIPALAAETLDLTLTRPVTISVGINGSGKSTILDAIASLCGFGHHGGNRNYDTVAKATRCSARCGGRPGSRR